MSVVPGTFFRLAVVAGLVLAPGREGSGTEAESGWLKLVTPHFEMISNAGFAQTEELVRELDLFRQVVAPLVGSSNRGAAAARVYYFKDAKSFRPFKPLHDGKRRPVEGFHAKDPLGEGLAFCRQADPALTRRVLFHEYLHLLTYPAFRRAPLWAIEGTAEVFSTFRVESDECVLGNDVGEHLAFLREHPLIPLRELETVDYASAEYHEERKAGRFYATSWLLSHYLVFGRGGIRADDMKRFAALCGTISNRVDAFSLAFNETSADVERRLPGYLDAVPHQLYRRRLESLQTVEISRVNLDAADVEFLLGRLLEMQQQMGPARRRLERAARLRPSDPRPAGALAVLHWSRGDLRESGFHVDKAIRLGSSDAFVYFLAAEDRYRRMQETSPSGERERWIDEGRQFCQRAIRLDPNCAAAHHLLGIYSLETRRDSPELAMTHVDQAVRSDPEYLPAQFTRASLLAAAGQFEAARDAFAALLAGRLSQDLREQVLRSLKEVEDRLHPGDKPASSDPSN